MKEGRNKKGRYERRMWMERWPGVLVDVGERGEYVGVRVNKVTME
jgi:hypothetical protein